ncbi:conserved hypothetical protein [Magnetospirillum sp. UT-4]|nr:conserved hypothetical protein [Magnetospirillum sp. UT-4]
MQFEIIVTDVTHMKRGEVCVAGWCPAEMRMIRPLRAGGQFWRKEDIGPHLFEMGNVVALPGPFRDGVRTFPHASEDVVLVEPPRLVRSIPLRELSAALSPSLSLSVADIFGRPLEGRKFIPVGTECRSLGAIDTNAKRLSFEEKETEDGPKLRCWFYDESNVSYNFAVSSRLLRQAWQDGGLAALEALRAGHRRAHVRIGLAGDLEDHCYAMVNGILFH